MEYYYINKISPVSMPISLLTWRSSCRFLSSKRKMLSKLHAKIAHMGKYLMTKTKMYQQRNISQKSMYKYY